MAQIETLIDKIIEQIRSGKKTSFRQIGKTLDCPEATVEHIALVLERAGLLSTHFSINLLEKPWASLNEGNAFGAADASKLPVPLIAPEQQPSGKLIDEYELSTAHVPGSVRIVYSEEERRPLYHITLPKVSLFTRAYLNFARTEISKNLPVEIQSVEGEDATKHIEELYSRSRTFIEEDLGAEGSNVQSLATILINEMFGLGEIESLISDGRLEEIVINASQLPVSVYHRKHGWLKTNIFLASENETENDAQQIARRVGRQISMLHPILDAHLSTGDRANATLFPISAHGNTLTLRLFARNPWTLINYLDKKNATMSMDMAALLWQAMHYEMNVLVAGGTASGKTSALNSLLAFIPPFQRIVTIEDTRELVLPSYQWNWVPLVTRTANPEGLGEVTMLDLVVNALRMRPDRIVMGEIRRKHEAEVLFEAMHTGHSVYGTMHADTGAQMLKRLIEPPIEVPASEVDDVHLLLVQYRDRRKNIRRTLEISEVLPGIDRPELNRVFSWKARTDEFQAVKPPHRYYEQMNLHTGMTESEVVSDQKDKAAVLGWMLINSLSDVDTVGRVMKYYYGDPDYIVDAAKKQLPPSKVL